jgi:hypothetical protein
MIRIGSQLSAFGNRYEVTAHTGGKLILRQIEHGINSNGTRYILGEAVKIIGFGESPLAGEVVGLNPIRARVTEFGEWRGYWVTGKRIRKGT